MDFIDLLKNFLLDITAQEAVWIAVIFVILLLIGFATKIVDSFVSFNGIILIITLLICSVILVQGSSLLYKKYSEKQRKANMYLSRRFSSDEVAKRYKDSVLDEKIFSQPDGIAKIPQDTSKEKLLTTPLENNSTARVENTDTKYSRNEDNIPEESVEEDILMYKYLGKEKAIKNKSTKDLKIRPNMETSDEKFLKSGTNTNSAIKTTGRYIKTKYTDSEIIDFLELISKIAGYEAILKVQKIIFQAAEFSGKEHTLYVSLADYAYLCSLNLCEKFIFEFSSVKKTNKEELIIVALPEFYKILLGFK